MYRFVQVVYLFSAKYRAHYIQNILTEVRHMRFGKTEWSTAARGEEHCFLLTNGLGGYSSMAITGANTRNDHAIFMGVEKAPNCRFHYLTNIHEQVNTGRDSIDLATQSYVAWSRNQKGYKYLQMFEQEYVPEWTYFINGITLKKQLVLEHEKNTLGIRYQLWVPQKTEGTLCAVPLMRFTPKDIQPKESQKYIVDGNSIISAGKCLYYKTNGKVRYTEEERIRELYFSYDARDGRDSLGNVVKNHEIVFEFSEGYHEFELIYSDTAITKSYQELYLAELERQKGLEKASGLKNPAAKRLVRSANQFMVKRDSTNGDSIIAGYPFFSDWGRDTMIALLGCGIETGQYERVKSVLRTFAKYCQKGLMPNLFPEGINEPIYNTADASLWFVDAVYEYYKRSGDMDFASEMIPVMKEIIQWYQKGTDYHILMDEDGLISAGSGFEQVTWMDVRIGEILPTPRHGKPVEINALWYNALKILYELTGETSYNALALKVKESFINNFWMEEEGYLKDVITVDESRKYTEKQIRCNQVWALSLPYSMLEEKMALKVLDTIEKKLYTPYGLRSLATDDPEFCPFCRGNQKERDLAYHQGTVWGFPLGAYLLSIMKWKRTEDAFEQIEQKLQMFENALYEGCVGQMAEIYDGEEPIESRGCYAQAWSVGEMLRVYGEMERRKNT